MLENNRKGTHFEKIDACSKEKKNFNLTTMFWHLWK